MLANLHTHTRRCRHAANEPDRAWVEASLAAGLRTLGFSDHCPWPRDAPPVPPPGFRSGVRMDPEETGEYVASLLALREEYAGRIDILIGFEAEHLPTRIAAQDELFARFPVDYLICGQHYIGDGSGEWLGDWSGSPTADEARLAAYADRCIEAMESGRYLYLAHPDVLNFTGPDEVYARHMGRLCDWLAAHDSPVEVNLLGLADGRHYPSERFLRLAAEHGNWATIGIDAHRPDAIREAVAGVEARALALCARCGLAVREPPLPAAAHGSGFA